MLVRDYDALPAELAIKSGFAMTLELSGTAWMDADHRPPVAQVDRTTLVELLEPMRRGRIPSDATSPACC